jgi:hypothetical protein
MGNDSRLRNIEKREMNDLIILIAELQVVGQWWNMISVVVEEKQQVEVAWVVNAASFPVTISSTAIFS